MASSQITSLQKIVMAQNNLEHQKKASMPNKSSITKREEDLLQKVATLRNHKSGLEHGHSAQKSAVSYISSLGSSPKGKTLESRYQDAGVTGNGIPFNYQMA